MAWKKNVLRKKAENFERMKLGNFNLNNERVLALEPLLQEVYASMRPKPDEYEARRSLVHAFNMIAKEIYGRRKTENIPVVVEFGSFIMDLFSTSSDLDLSVNFSSAGADFSHEKKIRTLRKFASKLYALQREGHVYGVQPITSARVPILKCIDRGTGVKCDVSVESRDGILNSLIIRIITSIDERFQKLSFLMKIWAKSHNINSAREGTLNSLSIILLVAFHLQTRKPPVLPPFSEIFKDSIDPEAVEKSASSFLNYGEKNHESLAHLFITLLLKLSSVEKPWPKGLCVSNRDASWKTRAWDSKVDFFSVEDLWDQFQNVARAVGKAEVKRIYRCIDISVQHISSFLSGELGAEVKELLFGQAVNPAVPRGISRLQPNSTAASERHPRRQVTKKRRKLKTLGTRVGRKRKWMTNMEETQTSGGDGRVKPVDPVDVAWSGIQQPTHASGWEATEEVAAGGWKETNQPSSWAWGGGWRKRPSSCSWGSMEQSNSDNRGANVGRGWEREEGNADSWGVRAHRGWKKCGAWERADTSSWGWGRAARSTQRPCDI